MPTNLARFPLECVGRMAMCSGKWLASAAEPTDTLEPRPWPPSAPRSVSVRAAARARTLPSRALIPLEPIARGRTLSCSCGRPSVLGGRGGTLPKDWDRAAWTLTVHLPLLPYLVSTSTGGICDLVTGGVPLLRRTAPHFADAPLAPSNADSLLTVAPNLPASADRATAREEIRVPKVAPKPPPPVRVSS